MSLNGETGKIDFVGKEKMAQLLEKHPNGKSLPYKRQSGSEAYLQVSANAVW